MKSDREYRNKNFERPFQKDFPIHVTFRSEIVKGALSMGRKEHAIWLRQYLPKLCRNLKTELMERSNNSNHLHLLVRTAEKGSFQSLLRALPGRIARQVLGRESLCGQSIKYFTSRPYSRILTWGREVRNVKSYIERNIWEASGKIRHQKRSKPISSELKSALEESIRKKAESIGRQLSFT